MYLPPAPTDCSCFISFFTAAGFIGYSFYINVSAYYIRPLSSFWSKNIKSWAFWLWSWLFFSTFAVIVFRRITGISGATLCSSVSSTLCSTLSSVLGDYRDSSIMSGNTICTCDCDTILLIRIISVFLVLATGVTASLCAIFTSKRFCKVSTARDCTFKCIIGLAFVNIVYEFTLFCADLIGCFSASSKSHSDWILSIILSNVARTSLTNLISSSFCFWFCEI